MQTRSGKLLVGQSGGCTAVINCSLAGVVEEALGQDEAGAVLGAVHGVEGLLQGRLIPLDQLSPSQLDRLARTPSAALGSCRYRLPEEDAESVVHLFQKHEVRYFIYIGGNDSAQTALAIAKAAADANYELNVVAVPKTIDNDLPLTDHCPGFGSAGRFLATVILDAGMDMEAMKTVEPVKIIEVMGRNAGWLAAASALGRRVEEDAPQIVWPAEVPFDTERFLTLVRGALDSIGHALIVVSENVSERSGGLVGATDERDAFGHQRVENVAQKLCGLVQQHIGVRARWDKPGTLQRMSSAHVSSVDAAEARQAGRQAVRLALSGVSNVMVTLTRESEQPYRCGFSHALLEEIAGRERKLPDEFFDRERMFPTAAFMKYALPLVGEDLPEHMRLGKAEGG